MKALLETTLLSLIVLHMGCVLFEAKETRFLRSAQDQATQQEVRQRLGAPTLERTTPMAESVWVYQLRTQQVDSRMTAAGTWCDEYILTFDSQGVLRRWTHQTQFHGGEIMPTYCVQGGYLSKS